MGVSARWVSWRAAVIWDMSKVRVHIIIDGGARLFDGLGADLELEQVRAIEAPRVTHVKHRAAN
jgi:hypothetical protein